MLLFCLVTLANVMMRFDEISLITMNVLCTVYLLFMKEKKMLLIILNRYLLDEGLEQHGHVLHCV